MSETTDDLYTIKVAPGVVAAIVRLAATEVPGVRGLAQERAMPRLLPGPRPSGGIHLAVEDGAASIDLSLVLEQDVEMQAVCGRVQQAVAEAVSNLVGMPVREVNVYVQDVR